MNETTKLIVYACPVGELAVQLDAYFVRAKARFSHNPAHDYMPHVTLTGFFSELPGAVPHYVGWLEDALAELKSTRPQPPLVVTGTRFDEQFHGLVIESPWCERVIERFIARADSPSRSEAIRPKHWLHLSLAYGFPAHEHAGLAQLAQEYVDPHAAVGWVLRLYERARHSQWISHAEWPL